MKIKMFRYLTVFNIIPKKVPVDDDGGLGLEFFVDNNVNIDYAAKRLEVSKEGCFFVSPRTFLLPERSITGIYLINKNPEVKQVTYLN